MQKLILIIYLFLPGSLQAQPAKNFIENDKQRLLYLEQKWLAAEFALDTAFLSTIMDTSFIGISENGIHNKQEDLLDMYTTISQRIKDSILIDSFRLEEAVVNLYEKTAVVTFIVHTFRKDSGMPVQRRTRFYDVWIKRKNKWLAVSSQGSKVNE
ncbi:MAG: nuclear transport factor 2 family protein [Ferruginibacter sp.]